MDKVFAIGDIHGNYDLLEKILPMWNPKEEQLVFLGDYIDRGPDSLKVIEKIMELSKEFGAIALSGNHEQIFLYWLKNYEKSSEFYFHHKVGGVATIHSLLPDTENIDNFEKENVHDLVRQLEEQHGLIIEFLKSLQPYYLWDTYLFVHAGINVDFEDFKQTKNDTFYWVREEFYSVPHKSKETVVFGHTPTLNLNEDRSNKVWISPCKKKIGIDGGIIYEGGQLHGVVITKDSNELTIYAAKKNEDVFQYTLLK